MYAKKTYTRKATAARQPTTTQVAKEIAKLSVKPKRVYKRTGAAYGRAIGNVAYGPVGAAIGAKVGRIAGRAYSQLKGRGDYSITNNNGSIMNEDIVDLPRFKKSDADIIISKCEYVGDIVSGSGTPSVFTEKQYYGNPGLNTGSQSGAFNWLSNIANAWESYEFIQCVFHYQPTSGNSTGANTALGQVVMAASYSPSTWQANGGFGSKQAMLDAQYAVTGPPSKFMMMPIECKRAEQNFKFHSTRSGLLSSNQNIDIFDMFGLSVATTGISTANQPLGELYVTYTIKLSKTQTNSIAQGVASHYTSANGTPVNDCTASSPLGTGSFPLVQRPGSNLPLVFNYSTNTVNLPPQINSGTFMLTVLWQGSQTTGVFPPGVSYTNASAVLCLGNSSLGTDQAGIAQETTLDALAGCGLTQFFQVTGAGSAIIFDTTGTMPSPDQDYFDISIIAVNPETFSSI